MAATATPYGMKPVKLIGSQPFAGAIREYPMTANSATAIFNGDMVNINSGTAKAVTATPTTTWGSTTTPIGVCVGVRYTDATSKQEVHSQYFPANGITTGHTNVFIKVVDDPDCIFQIQADGSVAATVLGGNAEVVFTAGSTTTGNSKLALKSSTVALTATFALRVVGFVDTPGSAVGDAYTDCYVKFNQGVHAFQNATGSAVT
jgi:hypothetical protein